MKRLPFLILIILLTISQEILSQSPFNYGRNKNVYFISADLRKQLGIRTIYELKQNEKNDQWDLEVVVFEKDTISKDWYPFSYSGEMAPNLDSIVANSEYMNGSSFESGHGLLKSYGGYGRGSFDRQEIYRYSKKISIVETTCSGHCSGYGLYYTKNLFDSSGNILYSLNYPKINDSIADHFSGKPPIADFNKWIKSLLIASGENRVDTIFYYYDSNGRLTSIKSNYKNLKAIRELQKLFGYGPGLGIDYFHQYYIGNTKFEDFIKRKTGFLPKLVLIEIYRYGVFSYLLNPNDKKYYFGKTVILEKYKDYY